MGAFLLVVFALLVPVRAEAFGGVDRSFGRDGSVDLFFQPTSNSVSFPLSVASSREGMIYVYQRLDYYCGGQICADAHLLLRFKPDGRRDTRYGGNGTVELAAAEQAKVVVDRQGRVLIGTLTPGGAQVLRLLPDGAVDSSFGSGGTASIGCSCPAESMNLTLDSSGNPRIALGGFLSLNPSRVQVVVASMTGRGQPNPEFGSGGVASTTILNGESPVTAANLAGGGQVLGVSLREDVSFDVVKLGPSGGIDQRFSAKARRAVAAWVRERDLIWIEPRILVPRGHGELDVIGQMRPGSSVAAVGFVLRLRRDGSIDRRFGRDGSRRFPWGVEGAIAGSEGRVFPVGETREQGMVGVWIDAEG
ncbi:MAG TPA: hypothetical protein VG458_02170, partial [Solirubrobacterales bacterium]|nr:hypothetical protein [Solirubrobacterales bacterium]